MNPTNKTKELSAALNALTAIMAVSISWPVLYHWAGINSLAVENYAQLLNLWEQVLYGANQDTPVPNAFSVSRDCEVDTGTREHLGPSFRGGTTGLAKRLDGDMNQTNEVVHPKGQLVLHKSIGFCLSRSQ